MQNNLVYYLILQVDLMLNFASILLVFLCCIKGQQKDNNTLENDQTHKLKVHVWQSKESGINQRQYNY